MERIGCKLCGSRDSFLVNLSDDYHNQVLLNFIAANLNIRLSPGPSCTVCGKCIGGLDSWRQLKQSIQVYQNASIRHHHNEPPLSSEPEAQRPRYYEHASPQEEFNPSILQAMSLAPSVGDPLSVVSIKSEAMDISLGSTSSLVDPFPPATPSSHQVELDSYTVKQEPLDSSGPLATSTGPTPVERLSAGKGGASQRSHDADSSQDERYAQSRQSAVPPNNSGTVNDFPRNKKGQYLVRGPAVKPSSEKRVSNFSSNLSIGTRPPDEVLKGLPSATNRNSKGLVIQCCKCSACMTSKDEIQEHWASEHNEEMRKRDHRKHTEKFYVFMCSICGQKFNHYNSARTHRKVHQESASELSNDREDEELDGDDVEGVDGRDSPSGVEKDGVCGSDINNSGDTDRVKHVEDDLVCNSDRIDNRDTLVKSDGNAKIVEGNREDRKAIVEKKEPIDSKARVAEEIRRQSLLYAHYRHVREDSDNNNTLDANVKLETLESLRKAIKTDKKTDSLVHICCKLITQQDKPISIGEDVEKDLKELGESKVPLLNVFIKTENIYNDAVEENSDYGQIPSNHNSSDKSSKDSNLVNSSATDHFLALASSENSVQGSLGDDQVSHSAPSVENNFQCNLCNVYFDTISLLGEHMKQHRFQIMKSNYEKGMNMRTEIQCEFCATPISVMRFRNHFDTYHHDVTFHSDPEVLKDSTTLRCAFCKEEFKRTVLYDSHMKTCFINRLIMRQLHRVDLLKNKEDDGKESVFVNELKQPLQGMLQRDFKKPFDEFVPKDSVPLAKRLAGKRRHVETDDEKEWQEETKADGKKPVEESYDCLKCGLRCGTKLRLDIHAMFHSAQSSRGSFSCYECHMRFASLCGARGHLKRVHLQVGSSVILCSHCLRTFKSSFKYRHHYARVEKKRAKRVSQEETDSEESEDENAESSEEVLEEMKKNLNQELGGQQHETARTSTKRKERSTNETTSKHTEMIPAMCKNKELKMLGINANFKPSDRKHRRRENDSGFHDNKSKESKRHHSGGSLDNQTRDSRRLQSRDLHARDSSTESASSSRTSRGTRSAQLTPRDLSPELTGRRNGVPGGSDTPRRKDSVEAKENQADKSKPVETDNEPEEVYYDQQGCVKKVFSCVECGMRFITEAVHKNHELCCKKGNVRKTRMGGVCALCNIYFADMSRHNFVHGNPLHRFKTDQKYIYVYQCPLCMTDMKQNIYTFERHMNQCKSRGSNSKKCQFCKRYFVNIYNKSKHQKSCGVKQTKDMFKRAKQPLLKCTYCCRHVYVSKESHDVYCKEPIEKPKPSQPSIPVTNEEKASPVKSSTPATRTSVVVSKTPKSIEKTSDPEVKSKAVNKPDVPVNEATNVCEKCGRTFSLKIAYNKHMIKCQGGLVEDSPPREETAPKALSCFLCPEVLGSPIILYNHYKKKHKLVFEESIDKKDRLYPCLYCKKPCKSFVKFNLHGHFHEKQKQLGLKTRESAQEEEGNKTEGDKAESPPRRNRPGPLSMKTRERSKMSGEKPPPPNVTAKETAAKSPLPAVESVLTTRSGTHVRLLVEDPASSKTHPSSPAETQQSSDKSSPDKEKRVRNLTENAKIMNSYKSKKQKKRTKCENCKQFIINNYYTQHAVLCIAKSRRDTKRTDKDIIMSGYIKKKKKNPSQMFCIHCQQHVRSVSFNSHVLKCERKRSYRDQQIADTNGGVPSVESSAHLAVKSVGPLVNTPIEKQVTKSASPTVKPPNRLFNISRTTIEVDKPTTITLKTASLLLKQPNQLLKPANQLLKPANQTLKPATPILKSAVPLLKSAVELVKLSSSKTTTPIITPDRQVTKSLSKTPLMSTPTPLKTTSPLKSGCQLIEVISLDDDPIPKRPALTITKVSTDNLNQVKPGPKLINLNNLQLNSSGKSLNPKQSKPGIKVINLKELKASRKPSDPKQQSPSAKYTDLNQPKSSVKYSDPKEPRSSEKRVEPSPEIEEDASKRRRRKSPLGDRTKQLPPPIEKSTVVQCPLCYMELHKRNAPSHYWYYHVREVENVFLYMELLDLSKELGIVEHSSFTKVFCTICGRNYSREVMKKHYRTHKTSRSEFKVSIRLLGFRNEQDFIQFLESKEDRGKRTQSTTSTPEVIELDDPSSPPSIVTRNKTVDSSSALSNAKNTQSSLFYQSIAESTRSVTQKPSISSRKPSRVHAEPAYEPANDKRSTRHRECRKPSDFSFDENQEQDEALDESVDENISIADLMVARGLKRPRKETKESMEESRKREKRVKHVLETSDPIILNEDDAGDLSECEDPLADPFGACQDGAEKLGVETPYRSYTTDEESGLMECDIAGVEDWESLEKKSGDQRTEESGVSSHEIEKKHELAKNIHNQIAERIQAALNKNSSMKKQELKTKPVTSEPNNQPPSDPVYITIVPKSNEKKASVSDSPVTKRTQPDGAISSQLATSSLQSVTKSTTSLVLTKPTSTPSKAEASTSAAKAKDERVNQPASKLILAKKVPDNDSSIDRKSLLNQSKKNDVPKIESKKKPVGAPPSDCSTKEPSTTDKHTPHRVEHKVAPRPADASKQSFAKAEKMKNKLLLKFKKEKSQNSYSVYQKSHGTSRPDSNKKSLDRPRQKEFVMNHQGKKHPDQNLTKKLREVKITKKRHEDSSPGNTLQSKVQSIAREITSNLNKTANATSANGQSSTINSSVPADNSTSINDANKPTQEQTNPAKQPSVPKSADVPLATHSHQDSSSSNNKVNAQTPPSQPTPRMTFLSTFVPATSPPPVNTKASAAVRSSETHVSSETPAASEDPHLDLLQAPGSPLFPPPPSHIESQPALPDRPLFPTASSVSAEDPPKSTSIIRDSNPLPPDSPPMFPTLSKAVGIPAEQVSSVTSDSPATYTDLSNTLPLSSSKERVEKGNAVFEVKQRSSTSYQDARSTFSSHATPAVSESQSSMYSNVGSSPQKNTQNSFSTAPVQSQQTVPVQYTSTHDGSYIEYPKLPNQYSKSSSYNSPSPQSYIEYPKTSPMGYTQNSNHNTRQSNSEAHHSNPASPMYAMTSQVSPASHPSPYERSPSSPMPRPASRSLTPGVPSPSPTDASGHVYPATTAQQPMKLPPVSSLVYRNTPSPYPYPSSSYQEPPSHSPGQAGSYALSSPNNYSSSSNLTDNLLSIPKTSKKSLQESQSSLHSPASSAQSYAPTSSFSPVSRSQSPGGYGSLNTAYPISSAYASPPVSAPITVVSKPRKKPASTTPSYPTAVSSATTTYPNYSYESLSQPAAGSNLISYPIGSTASYSYPAYSSQSLGYTTPATSYTQSPSGYIGYPPVETHHPPPPSAEGPQGFRPYEASPYHSAPLLYDYAGPSYGAGFLPPNPHAPYPPGSGAQYNLPPRAPSPPTGYYNHPPDNY